MPAPLCSACDCPITSSEDLAFANREHAYLHEACASGAAERSGSRSSRSESSTSAIELNILYGGDLRWQYACRGDYAVVRVTGRPRSFVCPRILRQWDPSYEACAS